MTKVSVIIPTLYEKDGEYLKLAVESLRETVDWDIIVVTNGMKHKPNLSHIKGITVHLHTPKQGQCNAVNVGAQVVNPSTEYIMVSNADMYYAPSWNKNLRFEYPVFSPNLMEPVNNGGSAAPFLKEDGGLTLEEFNKAVIDKAVYDSTINGPTEPENGFNLPFFIRKNVWIDIGGYDAAYDPWGSNSDSDLQAKIHLAGIQTKRLRDVIVYHFGQKSGTFVASNQRLWQRNWDYFTDKWGFNRDTLGSDVWYSKDILPIESEHIAYTPPWAGKYNENR